MILYLSHSAGRETPDWWIVEPRDNPERLEEQVRSLLRVGRRVVQIALGPEHAGSPIEVSDLPEDFQDSVLAELKYRDRA